jgi:sugar phosphate isomerase/epimerase
VQLPGRPFHLTYCTNIHAADGWNAVYANLRRYATALKARFSPHAPFGLGLRLSAREARELLDGDRLRDLKAFLDDEGLYVAIVNGFPYGPFHGTPVKANVYAPDWRDTARVDYTLDLIEIVRVLLPPGVDGGVSTAPLSYKEWMKDATPETWTAIARNIARVTEALVKAQRENGALIHLDIEPEPDCVLENTDETVAFFERSLLPVATPLVAARFDISHDAAREHLLHHVRLCFDCCHFAVEFEDPAAALERFRRSGIQIGRVQLSSALQVRFPEDAAVAARMAEQLQAFADATYLHQVVERGAGDTGHYPDLAVALAARTNHSGREWRVHFHVPLFAAEYAAIHDSLPDTTPLLASTQSYVARVLGLAAATPFTSHLEIETYTWDVLPAGLKVDLLDSIAREYEWVLQTLDRLRSTPT